MALSITSMLRYRGCSVSDKVNALHLEHHPKTSKGHRQRRNVQLPTESTDYRFGLRTSWIVPSANPNSSTLPCSRMHTSELLLISSVPSKPPEKREVG